MILIFPLFFCCFLKMWHFCHVVALSSRSTTAAAPGLMSPSQEFLSQPCTAAPHGCSVTHHLPFSGDLKPKCCLLGFLISEQLGVPEVPHLVLMRGFLPGWLGPSSLVFSPQGRFPWKHRPTHVPTCRYSR